MAVRVPTALWAKVMVRAAETDRDFPWMRQREFYDAAQISIADEWTVIDLDKAESDAMRQR